VDLRISRAADRRRRRAQSRGSGPLTRPAAAMEPADDFRVSVAYCTPLREHLIEVDLPAGATLRDAVLASGLLELVPGLAADALDLGVFGQPMPASARVQAGDRIEVYRPLAVDPKTARRLRAELRRRRA